MSTSFASKNKNKLINLIKIKDTLVMKNCTKKLTYFVCSFCLIHTKETEKIKTNILIRIRMKKRFIRKKRNLFNIYASLNKWKLQNVKSVQTESVFFMILVKLFHRKNFINFIQNIFMEKSVCNFTNTHQLWEGIITTVIIGSQ